MIVFRPLSAPTGVPGTQTRPLARVRVLAATAAILWMGVCVPSTAAARPMPDRAVEALGIGTLLAAFDIETPADRTFVHFANTSSRRRCTQTGARTWRCQIRIRVTTNADPIAWWTRGIEITARGGYRYTGPPAYAGTENPWRRPPGRHLDSR